MKQIETLQIEPGDIASRLNLQGFDRATNLASQDIGRDMQNRAFQEICLAIN